MDIFFSGSYGSDKIIKKFLWIGEFNDIINICDSFKQKLILKSKIINYKKN